MLFRRLLQQIFPEASETKSLKERLPSIMVEPSEESSREEADPFHDPCDPAGGAQPHEDGVPPGLKRSSIPSIQIDYSRLTPPPSPTSSRAAPPCFPG
ncbi:protein LBH-like isoform X2 [Pimephales promelas]|uniref:protein LBH-like isoform X2 n=1 Tax=Pimephales promelas TaxID=90988 RepID=UPI001955535D|nr:protein LBH-like isoform X2 [Pimephales promelas]